MTNGVCGISPKVEIKFMITEVNLGLMKKYASEANISLDAALNQACIWYHMINLDPEVAKAILDSRSCIKELRELEKKNEGR